MEHDVGLQTGDPGELLPTFRTGGLSVRWDVGRHVKPQVVHHIKGHGAVGAPEGLVLIVSFHMALVLGPFGENLFAGITFKRSLKYNIKC